MSDFFNVINRCTTTHEEYRAAMSSGDHAGAMQKALDLEACALGMGDEALAAKAKELGALAAGNVAGKIFEKTSGEKSKQPAAAFLAQFSETLLNVYGDRSNWPAEVKQALAKLSAARGSSAFATEAAKILNALRLSPETYPAFEIGEALLVNHGGEFFAAAKSLEAFASRGIIGDKTLSFAYDFIFGNPENTLLPLYAAGRLGKLVEGLTAIGAETLGLTKVATQAFRVTTGLATEAPVFVGAGKLVALGKGKNIDLNAGTFFKESFSSGLVFGALKFAGFFAQTVNAFLPATEAGKAAAFWNANLTSVAALMGVGGAERLVAGEHAENKPLFDAFVEACVVHFGLSAMMGSVRPIAGEKYARLIEEVNRFLNSFDALFQRRAAAGASATLAPYVINSEIGENSHAGVQAAVDAKPVSQHARELKGAVAKVRRSFRERSASSTRRGLNGLIINRREFSPTDNLELVRVINEAADKIYQLAASNSKILDKIDEIFIGVLGGKKPITLIHPYLLGNKLGSFLDSPSEMSLANLAKEYDAFLKVRLSNDPQQIADYLRQIRINVITLKDIAASQLPSADLSGAIADYVDVFIAARNLYAESFLPLVESHAKCCAMMFGDEYYDDAFQLGSFAAMRAGELCRTNANSLVGFTSKIVRRHLFDFIGADVKIRNRHQSFASQPLDGETQTPNERLDALVSKNSAYPSCSQPKNGDDLYAAEIETIVDYYLDRLAKKKPASAAALYQHYFNGVSYEELGGREGLTRSRIQQRAKEGLDWLRERMSVERAGAHEE